MGKSDTISPSFNPISLDISNTFDDGTGAGIKAKKNRENPVCISLVEEPCVLIMRIIEYDHQPKCLVWLKFHAHTFQNPIKMKQVITKS